MLKQVHLYIKGDVIGVGFRAWTKIQAKILRVNGWVRNVDHQEVEAVLQADEAVLNKMIGLLKKGPPISRVDDVDIIWESPKEAFDGFEIRK